MVKTRIGKELDVSRLGLGCLVLTRSYAPVDEAEAIATFDLALKKGITFLDTAHSYGSGGNEQFVGRMIAGRPRDEFQLATKFGLFTDENGTLGVNGRPEYVHKSCEESL